MTVIRIKRGFAISWAASNPILAAGEPGLELDTGQIKYGDGNRPWNDLPYAGSGEVITVTTAATLTPTKTSAQLNVTAQAGPLAIAAPAAPNNLVDGQSILFRIKDNGTSRPISWDPIYRAVGVTLPLGTVTNKTMYVGAKWNAAAAKYDVIAISRET